MENRRGPILALLLASLGGLALLFEGSPDVPQPFPGPALLPDRVVSVALSTLGLRYGDPQKRRAYAEHDYPGTPLATAEQEAAEQSSCLLHARGCLAAAGADGTMTWKGRTIDGLRVPYTGAYISHVETLLYELARQRGALLTVGADRPVISPGDIVVIGWGGSAPADETEKAAWLATWGGIAHGAVITGVRGDVLTSSDGGQPDSGNGYKPTAIAECVRTLANKGGSWWLGGRRVNYIIQTGKL